MVAERPLPLSTPRNWEYNGPLSSPEWLDLSKAMLRQTHLSCPECPQMCTSESSSSHLPFDLKALQQPAFLLVFCLSVAITTWQLSPNTVDQQDLLFLPAICLQMSRVFLKPCGEKPCSNPILLIKGNHGLSFTAGPRITHYWLTLDGKMGWV